MLFISHFLFLRGKNKKNYENKQPEQKNVSDFDGLKAMHKIIFETKDPSFCRNPGTFS
jgi:hypothetical protein